MAPMVRKQIYISERQDLLVKRLARMRGTSEAEVIRQANAIHESQPNNQDAADCHRSGAGRSGCGGMASREMSKGVASG